MQKRPRKKATTKCLVGKFFVLAQWEDYTVWYVEKAKKKRLNHHLLRDFMVVVDQWAHS